MNALKIFGIIVLGLTALFTGGCSLLFAGAALLGPRSGEMPMIDFWPIWGGGLVIAALCIWAVRALRRSLRAAALPGPDTALRDDPTKDTPR